ncbi:hypothetical protein HPB51_013825 [Rhipicephalus microplus]|uniref:Uncharacterized protein n=1 Tax=Rhipicephalus microplus TaxID=6941 RepID=A0A9J6F4K4_RHIMP|nr:hypothetical protein HPB51_013825 [Rhipicephalus microplus]
MANFDIRGKAVSLEHKPQAALFFDPYNVIAISACSLDPEAEEGNREVSLGLSARSCALSRVDLETRAAPLGARAPTERRREGAARIRHRRADAEEREESRPSSEGRPAESARLPKKRPASRRRYGGGQWQYSSGGGCARSRGRWQFMALSIERGHGSDGEEGALLGGDR